MKGDFSQAQYLTEWRLEQQAKYLSYWCSQLQISNKLGFIPSRIYLGCISLLIQVSRAEGNTQTVRGLAE